MPCFLRQALMEMDGSKMSEESMDKAMREVLLVLSDIDFDLPPVGVSLVLHRKLMEYGVAKDPYLSLKNLSTNKTKEILNELESMVETSGDRLELAAKIAIAGNVVDYGAANQLDLMKTLKSAIQNGMGVDDHELFREELAKAETLSYYLDNSGEVVLDGLFMRELIRQRPGLVISAYAKKVPLLNDVTIDDCIEAGLNTIEGVRLEELRDEGWASPEMISLNGGDIIIAKGQGNYESLSDMKGLYFLLVVKCDLISKELGASVGEMVFKKSS